MSVAAPVVDAVGGHGAGGPQGGPSYKPRGHPEPQRLLRDALLVLAVAAAEGCPPVGSPARSLPAVRLPRATSVATVVPPGLREG